MGVDILICSVLILILHLYYSSSCIYTILTLFLVMIFSRLLSPCAEETRQLLPGNLEVAITPKIGSISSR
ncbi:hypothetical protein BDW69DRAFT_165984 [Aspergillus filifer]